MSRKKKEPSIILTTLIIMFLVNGLILLFKK